MAISTKKKKEKRVQLHYHITERGNRTGQIHPSKAFHKNEKTKSYHEKGLIVEIQQGELK